MSRAIVKYIFCTFILVLSGNGLVSAHVAKFHSSLAVFNGSGLASFNTIYNSEHFFITAALRSTEKHNHSLGETYFEDQEDEDELVSLKKYLKNSNLFSIVFSNQVPATLSDPGKKTSPQKHHLFSTLSSRHISLRVFRI